MQRLDQNEIDLSAQWAAIRKGDRIVLLIERGLKHFEAAAAKRVSGDRDECVDPAYLNRVEPITYARIGAVRDLMVSR